VTSKGGINIDGIQLTCDWADVIEEDSDTHQVFISGLNEEVNEEEMKAVFSKYGTVKDIILSKHHKNSRRKDIAFVTFENKEQSKNCVDNFMLENKDFINKYNTASFNISLAFSQQAMQTKKKLKESRNCVNYNGLTPDKSQFSETANILVSRLLQDNKFNFNNFNKNKVFYLITLIR